jgi:hypothetical protein
MFDNNACKSGKCETVPDLSCRQAESNKMGAAQHETGAYEAASPIYGLFGSLSCADYASLSHNKMESQYSHRRLSSMADSFRLMILEPSQNPNALLRCKLQDVFLHSIPKFEALSYVWTPPQEEVGSSQEHYVAVIVSENYWLPITANCAAALRRLRRRQKPRYLFVDSICIDQRPKLVDSQAERNQQVRLMGTIYSKANRVLVWLGEGNDETKTLFRYLNGYRTVVWIEPCTRALGLPYSRLVGAKS